MAECIEREAAIAYIREQSEECQKAFEELGGESGIYADAYNDLAEDFYGIPAAKAVSLHDIYRVIAGHSYYHGDGILAALTCIAEGKEVNPVRPADVAPVVHGRWMKRRNGGTLCSRCGHYTQYKGQVLDMSEAIACPWCGAMMDGGAGHEAG